MEAFRNDASLWLVALDGISQEDISSRGLDRFNHVEREAMSMTMFGNVSLAAGMASLSLLGAAVARAADPQQGIAVWFAPQAVVVVAPQQAPVAADPFQAIRALDAMMDRGFPNAAFAQMVAQQNAMMQQLIAQMNAPFPAGMGGQGSQMVMTSMSGGAAGTCSRVVTMSFDGNGQPQTTVRQTGSACEALPQTGTVPAESPAQPGPEMRAAPPRLIQVDHRQMAPKKPVYRG